MSFFLKGELISQRVDPKLSEKIWEFVNEGVTNVREMKRLLKITVNDMFGKQNLPRPNNRRFFPKIDNIRAHMVRAKQKLR